MKVSVEDAKGLTRILKVEVEGDVVRSALDEVYNYLKQNAEVEGFRRGKAPLWIIRAKYREYIQEEVGKKVAKATLPSAIQETGLKPAVEDIYVGEFQLDEPSYRVSYKIAFEVLPDFELQNLEGLEVEIRKVEFKEEFVEERIEEIREEHALWEPVDREIREGDLVVVDYKVEDMESHETTDGEVSGIIGDKTFREEIERELLGKKEGDSFVLENLTLYDMEGNPVGKARVHITIKSVKEAVLPELNDDFAREAGLGQTWAEAEEKIRQEVKANLEELRKEMISEEVIVKLLQMHQFDVPQAVLQKELSLLVVKRATELSQWGMDPKYIDYKRIAEELKPHVISNIKLRYILDKYAEQKGIQASPEEVQKRIEELAKSYEKSVEEIIGILREENLISVLEGDIRREKAFEDILSKVVVKEVEERKEEKDEDT